MDREEQDSDDETRSSRSASNSEQEPNKGLFADLLGRIDGKDSSEPGSESTEPDESDASESPPLSVDLEDPIDRAHRVIAERLHLRAGTGTHNKESTSNRYRLLALTVVTGVLIGAIGLSAAAVVGAHLPQMLDGAPDYNAMGGNDTLYLHGDDARYLNRVYKETTHEVAYCGLITQEEEGPTLEIWMADTVNAGPDQVWFFTENCPEKTREVLVHTHPNGALQLSDRDKQTLLTRPERIMCVQGGELQTEPGAVVKQLACYRQVSPEGAPLELESVRVVISDPTLVA